MWVTPFWAWNPSICNSIKKEPSPEGSFYVISGSMKVNNACGIVGLSLLRCPAVASSDGADLRLADRCHSLCSLSPPPAAVASLPLRYVIFPNKKALFGEPFLFFAHSNFSLSSCWSSHKINGVIPNHPAGWCGDPPVTRENLPRAHRFVVLFDRGIATSATPPRNDTVLHQPDKFQFEVQKRGRGR